MKRIFLSIITVFIIIFKLSAQQTPEFEFTLYAHDIQGNIDSVVLGYDSLATDIGFDSQFGEIDITNQSWSNFEMRLSNLEGMTLYRKKEIGNYWCPQPVPGLNSISMFIILNPDTSDVYFTWDSNLFTDDCIDNTALADDYQFFDFPGLGGFNHRILKNGTNFTPGFNVNNDGFVKQEISLIGGGIDTAYVLYFAFQNMLMTSNTDIQKEIRQQTKVFPNPTTDNFTIKLPESYFSESVQIFDITGREVYQSVEKSSQIDVPSSTWVKGIYFYKVRLDDGIVVSGKVIKN